MLGGTDGEREVVQDALGEPIERDTVDRARATGEDLQLTLDAAIQGETEEVLAEVGQTYTPDGATAIVMDPRTAEILAMANWPRVDANDVAGAPDWARNDMAANFTYEPGSTFKAFTVAAALEDHKVTPQTMFDLPPTIQVADRKIEESHERGYVSTSRSPTSSPSPRTSAR